MIHGALDAERLTAAVARLLGVWPALASHIDRGRWVSPRPAADLVTQGTSLEDFHAFRAAPVDLDDDAPLALLWWPRDDAHRLCLRVHPAVADEQAVFNVFVALMLALIGDVPVAPQLAGVDLVQAGRLVNMLRLGEVARHIRNLSRFARQNAVFQLPAGGGAIATYSRWINSDVIIDKANRLGTSPLALVSTAWTRAVAEQRPDDGRSLVVAVPISLRNEYPEAAAVLGNLMWPVYLPVDRRASLRDAARAFDGELRAQTETRVHYAQPLAALGRRRFWQIARRFPKLEVPADFGTTRVTWTGHPAPLTERLAAADLRLLDQQVFTPVPPRMGVTLTVVSWPRGTQLLVNYRVDTIAEADVSACVSSTQHQIEA